jgi:ABC-type glycerol-3-phosphate transport system permease component
VWEGLHFGVLLQNSLIYAVTGSALSVGLALVPAFALSRFEPPGKK